MSPPAIGKLDNIYKKKASRPRIIGEILLINKIYIGEWSFILQQ